MISNVSLTEVIILLAAGVTAVTLFHRFHWGAVLGYLIAGALIGPSAIGLIDDSLGIRHLAEFGVVFLLFVIGIELKPSRLRVMRRLVFGLGGSQVLLTGLMFFLVIWALGVHVNSALIIGFGLALSSTALGLQLLNEIGELNTTYGRASFSVLLFQDVAVIPLLILLPLLTQDLPVIADVGLALLKAVLLCALVWLGAQFLHPVFRWVAATGAQEAFTALTLLVALGTALLLSQVGMSLALGAFMAGLLLSESEYRHQIIVDIYPFRNMLLGLFFMAIGMGINFDILFDEAIFICASVVGIVMLKAVILWWLAGRYGFHRSDSVKCALLLSQSGEFGFILFQLALDENLFSVHLYQQLILIVTLSMAITPFLMKLAANLINRFRFKTETDQMKAAMDGLLGGHVIIAGFGRVGRYVASVLTRAGIPYVAVDVDVERVEKARTRGFSVYYGDASNYGVWSVVGIEHARLLVVALDRKSVAQMIISYIHKNHPNVTVFAHARDDDRCDKLRRLGADFVVSETLEASLQMGDSILRDMGFDSVEITEITQPFRETKNVDEVV